MDIELEAYLADRHTKFSTALDEVHTDLEDKIKFLQKDISDLESLVQHMQYDIRELERKLDNER